MPEPSTKEIIQVSTLSFLYIEYPWSTGTEFRIYGYVDSTFESFIIKSETLKLGSEAYALLHKEPHHWSITNTETHTEHDMIFDYPGSHKGDTGYLFVRDIYVSRFIQPYSLFSYNFWDIQLDPDRLAPARNYDVTNAIQQIWKHVKDKEMVKLYLDKAINQKTADGKFQELLEVNCGLAPTRYDNEALGTWKEAWNELFGDKVMLTSKTKATEAEHKTGTKTIEVPEGIRYALEGVIKTDENVLEEFDEKERVPIDSNLLNDDEKINLGICYWLSHFLRDQYASVHGRDLAKVSIQVMKAQPNQGSYSGDVHRIRIRRDILANQRETVETFIHEYAHHGCDGCPDLTDEHVSEMEFCLWALYNSQRRPTRPELIEYLRINGVTPPGAPTLTQYGKQKQQPPAPTEEQAEFAQFVADLKEKGLPPEEYRQALRNYRPSKKPQTVSRILTPQTLHRIGVITRGNTPLDRMQRNIEKFRRKVEETFG